MVTAKFLQIHTLHSYPAALLNRDDSGLAKRLPFGDVVRTRISSQCLKRHWRMAQDEFALSAIVPDADAIRSRNVVDREVIEPLQKAGRVTEDVLTAVQGAFNVGVYGSGGTAEAGRQPLLLGLPEVTYLREKAALICDAYPADAKAAAAAAADLFRARGSEGANFAAFRDAARLPGGLVGALFGRMVTSDPAANIDAAIHVAHAFTVHREENESDYFAVVDDLRRDDESAGAAHIGDMELTAGLFYGYVVVHVPGLVSNLEGCSPKDWQDADRGIAGQVVDHLLRLIATVSPGAKLGSTAPYGYAELMLIEAGSRQPRSLANAFRIPVRAQVEPAVSALAEELQGLDGMYGVKEVRRISSKKDHGIPDTERIDLDGLASWAAGAVRKGEAV